MKEIIFPDTLCAYKGQQQIGKSADAPARPVYKRLSDQVLQK